MFQKVNFDTQEFRFIPLLSSLPFLRIYIYSPNERDSISIQIFSIPSSHRRYIQAFNLAKWLFDTAVSIDSNRFRNLRQFIRGFFAFSTNFHSRSFSIRENKISCLGRLFIIILAAEWSCVRSNYIKRKDGRADKAK